MLNGIRYLYGLYGYSTAKRNRISGGRKVGRWSVAVAGYIPLGIDFMCTQITTRIVFCPFCPFDSIPLPFCSIHFFVLFLLSSDFDSQGEFRYLLSIYLNPLTLHHHILFVYEPIKYLGTQNYNYKTIKLFPNQY